MRIRLTALLVIALAMGCTDDAGRYGRTKPAAAGEDEAKSPDRSGLLETRPLMIALQGDLGEESQAGPDGDGPGGRRTYTFRPRPGLGPASVAGIEVTVRNESA